MTSHEARIAEAIAELRNRLEWWGVSDPGIKAHEYVTAMMRNGWRPSRPGLDLPADNARPADHETVKRHADACREQLASVRWQKGSE